MLVDERRQKILNITENRGYVSLQELVTEIDASESTIRRDLDQLDGSGQIRRTRGGASYIGESLMGFEDRSTQNMEAKRRIAKMTADLIEPGEGVILDGGTTTLEVARHLVNKSLMVVTNSLPIANLLASHSNIELILIGGYVYPKTGVSLGPVAVDALRSINVRRLVMSVGGITEKGLFNSNTLLVETEKQMMNSADEVIVVADHGKFGHSALAHLCPLDRMDKMIVDRDVPESWKSLVREQGVAVLEEE
ncbi:DeoR/GlpR family DNA-binding transcription regulator [Planctomycetaceae bacterium]|jgi:DeoR family transcriptional regulator, fructose operon transcriptional repressor|nr:DeoR/GlpR family DNA-binding transcription regulator [Planctomycetaceae bacterium]MDC0261660.1 DeoR/GlpR family DNA-binding transcription regulator [Planctomycetaceae bacterium]MDC0273731.1 DeoR/GlpR family DNA-binding transcription regulator [Planctomycetaceae bacterium]MDC0273743.1 DeoR/GlpR family DNA-binding transcription regulator [Planctomycetaceae bacterium]MDC0308278.1 DeoR/GlpR family DNA-binding transcription regulator [Planctomycetaceae bacterium]